MAASPTLYSAWIAQWETALRACIAHGGDVVADLSVGAPATESDLVDAESQLGLPIPPSLRETFRNFSERVSFCWTFPDDVDLPRPFRDVNWSDVEWGLDRLIDAEDRRRDAVADDFPNPEDPYHRVWHDKLAFAVAANGDLLALDLAPDSLGAVVYLSQDHGAAHGRQLASDFQDFITRWTALGCPGPEEWGLLPFLPDSAKALDPTCQNALLWRSWFGRAD